MKGKSSSLFGWKNKFLRRSSSANKVQSEIDTNFKHSSTFAAIPRLAINKRHFCHICKKSFTVLRKKVQCVSCGLPICKKHTVKEVDHTRICNVCTKEKEYDILSEVWGVQKKKLQDELVEVIKETNRLKKIRRKLDTNISSIQTQIKFKDDKFGDTKEALQIRIENQEKRSKIQKNKYYNFRTLLEKSKQAQVQFQDKLDFRAQQHSHLEMEADCLSEDIETLQKQLEEYLQISRGNIAYQVIRKILCNICYRKVKYFLRNDGNRSTPYTSSRADGNERKACCVIY